MKHIKLSSAIVGLIALIIVSSCNKDQIKTDDQIKTEVTNTTSKTRSTNLNTVMANRVRFSKAFSKAIQNQNFYNFIVAECRNSNFNDDELLYAEIYNKQISTLGSTFANYLATKEASLGVIVSNSSVFYNTTCVTTDPLLGIVVMPGAGNDASTIGQITNSKKVYVDKIFDEFVPNESITFSFDGTTSSQIYGSEPVDPYFAIKQNEVYIAYDMNTEIVMYNEPLTLTTCGSYIRYNDVKSIGARVVTIGNTIVADKSYDHTTQSGSATPRSCTEPCIRDCNTGKDAITRIKFNHDYEGWPRGGPEFIMQYSLGLNNNTTITPEGFVLQNSSRNDYILKGSENTWYTANRKGTSLINIQLLNWDKYMHTSDMQELWTEDDGNTKNYSFGIKLGYEIKGVKIEIPFNFSIMAGDDNVGTVVVQFCDNWTNTWGYQYTVAGVSGDVFFAQLDRDY